MNSIKKIRRYLGMGQKNKKLYQAILWLVTASLVPSPTLALTFKQFSDQNMQAVPFEPSKFPAKTERLSYSDYLEHQLQRELHPSKAAKREFAFSMLIDHEDNHPEFFKTTQVLDPLTSSDLNTVCGPESNYTLYLGSQIDRTSTEVGRAMLLHSITNPMPDLQKLKNTQAIVQELINNQELFETLDQEFKSLAEAENVLLAFWENTKWVHIGVRPKNLVSMIMEYMPEHIKDRYEALKENELSSEVTERLGQFQDITMVGFEAGAATLLPIIGIVQLARYNQQADQLLRFGRERLRLPLSTHTGLYSLLGATLFLMKQLIGDKVTEGVYTTIAGTNSAALLPNRWDATLKGEYIRRINDQTKLMLVARYVTLLKKLEGIISGNAILQETFPRLKNIQHLVNELPKESLPIKRIFDLLESSTFKGEPSFFSLIGRVVLADKLIRKHLDKFTEGIIALGELDMYMSTARLYKEGQGRANTWSFADYLENADAPSLEIENFWNPFIDPEKAVANSASIGTNNNPRMLIISGPNAGGKSTTMKGIAISVILAQSLGIVPASCMSLTPVAKIMTYLNIVDDIAAGNSHFKAGVVRARELVKMTENLQNKEFAFVATDEVFDGTSHIEGEAAAYSLIEALGKHPNVMGTTATHFPLVTELEKEANGKLFKNYKVSVLVDGQGQLQYPFKLEEGISEQNVALDILRNEGFDDAFLSRAYDLVRAHKRNA